MADVDIHTKTHDLTGELQNRFKGSYFIKIENEQQLHFWIRKVIEEFKTGKTYIGYFNDYLRDVRYEPVLQRKE